jgi:glycosyltransferase involved in cell wall biosynthesis
VHGPRVTFVGHDASRTGAPTVLRSFLSWLVAARSVRARLVLLAGGPLVGDFERLVPTVVTDHGPGALARTVASGIGAVRPGVRYRLEVVTSPRAIASGAPDVVVAGSLAALSATVAATGRGTKVVCHVHELDGVAERVLPPQPEERDALLSCVARFVAAGGAVRTMLVDRWGIPDRLVVTVDEFIDPPRLDAPRAVEVQRPSTSSLLVSAGAVGARKGTDFFVDLLATLPGGPGGPAGLWVGGEPSHPAWIEAEHDIEAAGLTRRVRLLPTVPDPTRYLAAADVFVTTAREDPYPLVVLEAAAAGTAVAGFASGGVAAMMADAGLDDSLVPVGDVISLADLVSAWCASPADRARRGRALSEWVSSSHLTSHLAPRLWDAIAEVA